MSSKASVQLLGKTFQREVAITDDLIQQFARFSGDHNPIHFSDEAAQRSGFPGKVAHGLIQASLLSAVVGMDLPGPGSVIHRLEMKWQKPCYAGDRIAILLEISEEHESVQTVVCRVKITNQLGEVISRGLVQVGTGGVHD